MKTYFISFRGRKNTAIGITYPNTTTIRAENAELAELALYDKYEHISKVELIEVD